MQIRGSRLAVLIAGLATLVPPTLLSAADWPSGYRRTVEVCMDPMGPVDDFDVIAPARRDAASIFETAGIRIKWLGSNCPEEGIRVRFTFKAPPTELPGSLAYALVSDRTVVVFYDRVQQAVESWRLRFLVGHVIVHEVTHILQGENRHSATGVMKGAWEPRDYQDMEWKRLRFTPEDIKLIHKGLDRQPLRAAR